MKVSQKGEKKVRVSVVFSCQKTKDNIQQLLWLAELVNVALYTTDVITMHDVHAKTRTA